MCVSAENSAFLDLASTLQVSQLLFSLFISYLET